MRRRIDVNLISEALVLSAFAVMRDPRIWDIVVSTIPYPHVCFSCHGSACDELVWHLAKLLEDVCRAPIAEQKFDDEHVCVKCVDARL